MTVSGTVGVVIHWPGSPAVADVPTALRSWQRLHMADRGWDDIAYQVAVDQDGELWELRGFGVRSAANGSASLNRTRGAVLAVLGVDEKPTPELLAGLREAVHLWRSAFPKALLIEPHSRVRPGGTDCPGELLRAAIAAGELDPSRHRVGRGGRPRPTPAPRRGKAPAFPLPPGYYYGPRSGPDESVSGYRLRNGDWYAIPKTYKQRAGLTLWQTRVKARGYDLATDGLYGPQTAGVAFALQARHKLPTDSLIGPRTWAAAWEG